MKPRKVLPGNSIDEIWEHVYEDAATDGLHNYHADMQLKGKAIKLDIVSSPGGGDEGGYSYTTLYAELPELDHFHFIIYPEDFLNKIGKFFGMQDVDTGYEDLDKYVIIKTNEIERLKNILSDSEIRADLLAFSGFSLKVEQHDDKKGSYAEFSIQHVLTDSEHLKMFLDVFSRVLKNL